MIQVQHVVTQPHKSSGTDFEDIADPWSNNDPKDRILGIVWRSSVEVAVSAEVFNFQVVAIEPFK